MNMAAAWKKPLIAVYKDVRMNNRLWAPGYDKARQIIRERLTEMAPVFVKQKHMLGEEFSMLDVAIAPLLWRLDHYGIELPKSAAPLMKYAERIFSRQGYIDALTPSEKAMRR